MTPRPSDAKQVARRAARIVDEKKGADIVVLEIAAILNIADYFVIATGQNSRQVKAMMNEIRRTLVEEMDVKPFNVAGEREARWILMDYGSVVIHLFDEPTRAFYDLELLWGDAPRLDWQKGIRRSESDNDGTG